MVYRPVAALRHVPRQNRGERKVEKILRSAEVVFAEVGYEHATTNAVAAHAGVSIGSLYQFFASKDKILEAMATRYLDQTRVALVRALDPERNIGLTELLTDLLETLLKLQEQRPFFLQCLAQNRAYAVLAGPVAELNEAVIDYVVALLKRKSGSDDSGNLRLRASVCVYTVSALLPYALSTKGAERRRVIGEIVKLLDRYLKPELIVGGR